MYLDIDRVEAGEYVINKVAVMLHMIGVRNVFHHSSRKDYDPNSLYVMSDVEKELIRPDYDRHKHYVSVYFREYTCSHVSLTMDKVFRYGDYDIAIINENTESPILLYDKDNNIIHASDLFHDVSCADVAVLVFSKLIELIGKYYPENMKTDTPLLYHVDLGDEVLDLRTLKKYPKAKLGAELKKELVNAVKTVLNDHRSWKA